MASATSIESAALDSIPSRREKLRIAFTELDAQRSLLANCTTEWTELESYFAELEKGLQQKFEELAQKERDLEVRIKESNETLDMREGSISSREEASLARVQEQKDAAIAAILEEKRKWNEERQAIGDDAPLVFSSASQVSKMENALKANIVEANGRIERNRESASERGGREQLEVRVRPDLKSLCESMDGEGLRKYIIEHRKDLLALRKEVPSALQGAIDPSRLVLKALEGYDIPPFKASDNKDAGASADCRACIILLESLSQALAADRVLGKDQPVLSPNVKESAKGVARFWRSKLDIQGDALHVNPFDAQAFLQLLTTFGIASEFDDDELCRLVSLISHRKDAPDLCQSLGLSSKIPELVDRLSNDGKQIQALSFAHAFGIMDHVDPVSLLKSFLEDIQKAAEELTKIAPNKAPGQNDAKELSALRAVLRAVKEYNLEAQYPTDSLQKRLDQLEKAKEDRKRGGGGGGGGGGGDRDRDRDRDRQPKRFRRGSRAAFDTGAGAAAMGSNRMPFGGTDNKAVYWSADGGQFGVSGVPSYGLTAAGNQDRRMQAGYGSVYGATSRPLSMPSSFQYPPVDGLGSNAYGMSSTYTTPPGSYGSYQFANSLTQSAYQPFIS